MSVRADSALFPHRIQNYFSHFCHRSLLLCLLDKLLILLTFLIQLFYLSLPFLLCFSGEKFHCKGSARPCLFCPLDAVSAVILSVWHWIRACEFRQYYTPGGLLFQLISPLAIYPVLSGAV